MTMTRRRYSSMTRRSRAFVLRCILSLVVPRRVTRWTRRRARARLLRQRIRLLRGQQPHRIAVQRVLPRRRARPVFPQGSRRAPVDVRAEDSEGAAAVARGGCANDGAVGDARDVLPPTRARPRRLPRSRPARHRVRRSPRLARSGPRRPRRPAWPSRRRRSRRRRPADAGEARPRQTAVEARGGPAPRDGQRRGRGFASGSRARAPPARGRVRRARGVTGRHAGALRPTGRRRARARRCAPRRGSSRGRESTHTRFLGWSDQYTWLVFFHQCRRQESNVKKTLSPPRREPRCAQLPAQRTTCEHERRSW